MKEIFYTYSITVTHTKLLIEQTYGYEKKLHFKKRADFRKTFDVVELSREDSDYYFALKEKNYASAMHFLNGIFLTHYFPLIKKISWCTTSNSSIVTGHLSNGDDVVKIELHLRDSKFLILRIEETTMKRSELYNHNKHWNLAS